MIRPTERHALPGDVWHNKLSYSTWIVVGKGKGHPYEELWAVWDIDREEVIQRAVYVSLGFSDSWERISP